MSGPFPTPYNLAVPPLIPGSQMLQTLEVDVAKITSLMGDALSKINTWKSSCVVATTANIVLSGLQTIDGVPVVAGDRVLVKDQTVGVENGIYVASAGAWSRSEDLPEGSSASGVAVYVNLGAVGAAKIFACDNPMGLDVVGTNDLTFMELSSGAETLEDLTDVTITAPVTGQALLYSPTGWINSTVAGSGDVIGPASSTADALATFDGATGKLLKDSTIINTARCPNWSC